MKIPRLLMVAAGLAATLAIPAAAGAQVTRVITIPLAQQGGSGVAGTATLTDLGGGQTQVIVRVSVGSGGSANMPAHLHDGTCANLNPAPKYPLNNVANGTSTSVVSATLPQILGSPMALNVHKSPTEVSVYVACGNVVAGAAALPATGGPMSPVLPALVGVGVGMAGAALYAIRRRFA
jgi:LPXTG-motif cell wall-anchored protein